MAGKKKRAKREPKRKPDQSKVLRVTEHAKKSEFLQALAARGFVTMAAAAVGINRSSHYFWMENDDTGEYAAAVEDAQKQYIEKLEAEADRRAVEGCQRVDKWGTYREYSDTLLIFRLKRLDPRYRDHIEVSAKVGHGFDREALAEAVKTQEGREAVRKLTELMLLAGAKVVGGGEEAASRK